MLPPGTPCNVLTSASSDERALSLIRIESNYIYPQAHDIVCPLTPFWQ